MEDIKLILCEEKKFIEEEMDKKSSPKVIARLVKVKSNIKITADNIIDFIHDEYKKEWSNDKRRIYISVASTDKPIERVTQISFSDNDISKESFIINTVEENTPQEIKSNDKNQAKSEEQVPNDDQSQKITQEPDNEPEPVELEQSTSDNENPTLAGINPPLNTITTDDKSTHDDAPSKNDEVPSGEGTPKKQLSKSDDHPQNHIGAILEKTLDHLEAIHKTVRQLKAEHREIKNQITSIEKKLVLENPIQKVNNLADDMIKIYANENSKKNVNINPVINDRVIELMKSKFNIQNNNAQAINTALLIALYKSKIDEKDEK